jgi:hypothetical protein
MTDLHLFGGEKGGVGKSLVARTAIQYHLDNNLDFICFDTDRSNPDIYRIYGKILDCQLGIFSEGERYEDTANAIFNAALQQRVLVNLPAQVLIPVKEWFAKNDLLEIASEAGITFWFWFVSDGGFDSLNLLRKTVEHFQEGVRYVVIKNYGKCDEWEAFDQDKLLQKLLKKHHAQVLDYPKFLGSVVRNRLDAESLTFNEALEHPDFGLIEKQRVRKFLRETYAIFQQAGVFDHAHA